jgi:hypothetical protein
MGCVIRKKKKKKLWDRRPINKLISFEKSTYSRPKFKSSEWEKMG